MYKRQVHIILTATPTPAFTSRERETAEKRVTMSFDQFLDKMRYQTMPLGTPEMELNLPGALKVVVRDEAISPEPLDWEIVTTAEADRVDGAEKRRSAGEKQHVTFRSTTVKDVRWEYNSVYDKEYREGSI